MNCRRLPPRRPRFDWRDPQMPVLRDYRMGNGERKTEVDPDYERRYREHMMQASNAPTWRTEPTYDLKRNRTK